MHPTLSSSLVAALALAAGAAAQDPRPARAPAAEPVALDYAKIDRRIAKEPAYVAAPRYAMFVFGPRGEARMWAVLDKSKPEFAYHDVLYLDRDCDGDLTDADERFTATWNERGARAGMAIALRVGELPVPGTDLVHRDFLISTVRKKGRHGIWFRMKWNGEHEVSGGYGPVGTDVTRWSDAPATAPILRPDPTGPLSFALYSWGAKRVELPIGEATKVYVMAGSPGSGPDTLSVVDEEFLDLLVDELWVTLIGVDAQGKEVRTRTRLMNHC